MHRNFLRWPSVQWHVIVRFAFVIFLAYPLHSQRFYSAQCCGAEGHRSSLDTVLAAAFEARNQGHLQKADALIEKA